jgi:sulfide dehydrogenase [flavocytochrome c] flavoprotein chain
MSEFKRRDFLRFSAGAAALSALAACATTPTPAKARVVVVGGGFGGATAAKYIRMWDPSIDVVLIDRDAAFLSCPMSNLVIAGYAGMNDITHSRSGLERYGVQVVRDEVTAIDPGKRTVRLSRGSEIAYERLIVSPGIDFTFGDMEGYEAAMKDNRVLHAWKPGPQTVALRRQLEDMPDGGVYAITVPPMAYRCPPGPYERATLVAAYFRKAKPRSKVLILDANPDITSKAGLFRAAWKDLYPGMIEYRGSARAIGVDGKSRAVRLEFENVKADVLNVIPPHRAADLAIKAGLAAGNNRWCEVDWRTMESKVAKAIHVLGDATLNAPVMPKSASMANNHAKIAAAAVVELLNGRTPPTPKILNTCYSFVAQREAIRVSSVHEWNAAEGTLVPVKGAGGVSAARSEAEANFAWNWARSIWADSLT